MIRLIYFILTYILFSLLRTFFIVLGWIIIPPLAILNKYTTKEEISKVNGRTIINWKSRLFWVFSNQEDGLDGASEFRDKPLWFRIIYWSAIRNPANNLRFVPFLSLKIDPTKIKYVAYGLKPYDNTSFPLGQIPELYYYDRDDYTFVTLIWQGLYSNFRIQFKMFGRNWRFWIGWKIYIHDIYGINPDNYRYHGAGFATQLKRIYPRENK